MSGEAVVDVSSLNLVMRFFLAPGVGEGESSIFLLAGLIRSWVVGNCPDSSLKGIWVICRDCVSFGGSGEGCIPH